MVNNCRVLLLDDDKNIRRSLQIALQNHGHHVTVAQDPHQAFQFLKTQDFDIAVVDVVLGEISGVDFFSRARQLYPHLPVIFMSGEASLSEVARLMKLGASDFLEKPFSPERLILSLERSLEFARLQSRLQYLEQNQDASESQICGNSAHIREIRELITRVAPTNAHTLITGESGTGKELVARQLHLQSKRSKEPFIKINCSAIPETLIESELFGHEKGSFTGAVQSKKGYFELAHKGTLFLDEIGDLSLSAQAKVLRAIQCGEIQAVGATQVRKVDVRLVAATHKNLEEAVRRGEFREDLYFRINVVPIHLLPLREREGDVALLAQKLVADIAKDGSYTPRTFSAEALVELSRRSWAGNIRELRNFIERLLILGGGLIQPEDLVMPIFANAENVKNRTADVEKINAVSLKGFRDQAERLYIVKTLNKVQGNISKAAEILEIERTYLHRRMSQFKIEKKEYF